MSNIYLFVNKYVVCLLVSLILLAPQYVVAEDRFLESIDVETKRNHSIIDIRLNEKLTVISYAPRNEGDLLRLRVRRVGFSSRLKEDATSFKTDLQTDEKPTNFETLPWSPTAALPLYNVTVDLQGAILLYFKRTVSYEVLPSTNAFHILIRVKHPERITKLESSIEQPLAKDKVDKVKKIVDEVKVKNPELAGYMDEARRALLNKEYTRAIQLYTKVNIKASKSIYGQQALEYLGLARERNKQFAHAKAIYERYIKLYPDSDDTERVRQRLSGILLAETEPKKKLKEGKAKDKESFLQWDTFGSFSQFYNRNVTKFNDDESRLNRSALQNSLDFTSRLQNKNFSSKIRFSGNYTANIESPVNDEKRINSLYIDNEYKSADIKLRVGRQSNSSGGILGRFDGAVFSMPITPRIKLNVVAGYSVLSSKDIFIDTDQYFYGANVDFGTFFDSWDFNAFYIEQYNQKILDRRAIGGEIKFFQENKSFFSFIDYDIYHNVLNSFLFTGQWGFSDRTIVNVSYDYRTSPFLTSSSAIQGQSFRNVEDLKDLSNIFSRKEIKQIAKDRTAVSQSVSLSISRPLSEKFQLNTDFRVTTTSGTKTSVGVTGRKGTGKEYSYSADLTGSSLLSDGDIYVLGLRYSDLQKSNTTTARFNMRYPVTKNIRINPRFRFDYRDNQNNTKRYGYQTSVRIIHRIFKSLQLEVEGGGEWSFQEKTAETLTASANDDEYDRTKGYFVIVGYRYNF